MFHSHVHVCRNVDLLIRAYLAYIRPLVEHDSVIWSPYMVKDIEAIETTAPFYKNGYLVFANCLMPNV